LNGQRAQLQADGAFATEVALHPGANRIAITATDMHRNVSRSWAIESDIGRTRGERALAGNTSNNTVTMVKTMCFMATPVGMGRSCNAEDAHL
jgi:hypothetical protein